jgi:hypothetical protein
MSRMVEFKAEELLNMDNIAWVMVELFLHQHGELPHQDHEIRSVDWEEATRKMALAIVDMKVQPIAAAMVVAQMGRMMKQAGVK